MIDIKDAIIKSKEMKNVSDGGSDCFDFGDVVLVKYSCPKKFIKDNIRTRSMEDDVMEGVNKKADMGVNTPRHLQIFRPDINDEGDDDLCYVLEEKCKGVNCAPMGRYGVSFDEMIRSLKEVDKIPYEHIVKLVSDGCMLYEMGYEAKNKNLFYDNETGFWYIDFLSNDKDDQFDGNDISKVFEAVKCRIPRITQLVSQTSYLSKLTQEQEKQRDELYFKLKIKMLAAYLKVIPTLRKYDKFFLITENDDYKRYLMEHGYSKNLFALEESDYQIFNELYELVLNKIVNEVIGGKEYRYIVCNSIRIDSGLFNLPKVWMLHKSNPIKREEFEEDYDYRTAVEEDFGQRMLEDVIRRVSMLKPNEIINKFLEDAQKSKNNRNML